MDVFCSKVTWNLSMTFLILIRKAVFIRYPWICKKFFKNDLLKFLRHDPEMKHDFAWTKIPLKASELPDYHSRENVITPMEIKFKNFEMKHCQCCKNAAAEMLHWQRFSTMLNHVTRTAGHTLRVQWTLVPGTESEN